MAAEALWKQIPVVVKRQVTPLAVQNCHPSIHPPPRAPLSLSFRAYRVQRTRYRGHMNCDKVE